MRNAAPRIYCIPASRAPVVAVLRRGPSDWAQVGRWDLDAMRFEPGSWLRARIFPRRSDLSPDGRYLLYFAHDPRARWEHGDAYVAISRLPWLHALHAFGTCGTWTRGYHFTEARGADVVADEDLPIPFGLRPTAAEQFATERRLGWEETADCPPRDLRDAWDQNRNACLDRARPGGGYRLRVASVGHAGGEFGQRQAVDGLRVQYSLERGGTTRPLDELQWADWDAGGRLLAATRAGCLQVREAIDDFTSPVFEFDLTTLAPDASEPPQEARSW